MNADTIKIVLPIALLLLLALAFFLMAERTRRANPDRYSRARRLSGTAKDVALGSVGWKAGSYMVPDVECGMARREIDGKPVIARQARLTHDTASSL